MLVIEFEICHGINSFLDVLSCNQLLCLVDSMRWISNFLKFTRYLSLFEFYLLPGLIFEKPIKWFCSLFFRNNSLQFYDVVLFEFRSKKLWIFLLKLNNIQELFALFKHILGCHDGSIIQKSRCTFLRGNLYVGKHLFEFTVILLFHRFLHHFF